jgi:hypothetical protein
MRNIPGYGSDNHGKENIEKVNKVFSRLPTRTLPRALPRWILRRQQYAAYSRVSRPTVHLVYGCM